MSQYSYYARFEVKIRPDAVDSLQAGVDDGNLGEFFSLNDGVLTCEVASESMSESTLDRIHDFTTIYVSDAAAESIVVHVMCDAIESQYGIGPEAGKALSAHRLDEIRRLATDLTDDDSAVLAQELGTLPHPRSA